MGSCLRFLFSFSRAGVWSCGQVIGLIKDVPTCEELVTRIVGEAKDAVTARLGAMLSGSAAPGPQAISKL